MPIAHTKGGNATLDRRILKVMKSLQNEVTATEIKFHLLKYDKRGYHTQRIIKSLYRLRKRSLVIETTDRTSTNYRITWNITEAGLVA